MSTFANALREDLGVSMGASVEELDRAFTALMMPTPAQRQAWRVLRDPYYAQMAEVWGEKELEAAGYFDDLASPAGLSNAHSPSPITTPTHKLTRADKPVVLLCTGAYSPPHHGHMAMMEQAREALTARGHFVAGGYLAPDHDAYVSTKRSGAENLPAPHRLQLCQLMVADSEWLMIDPWAALWTRTAINYTDIIARLRIYLRCHWHPQTEIAYVCGSDNSGFGRAFRQQGLCVIIPRDIQKAAPVTAADIGDDPLMREAIVEGRVIFAASHEPTKRISSTSVRATGEHIAPEIIGLCHDWRLDWVGKLGDEDAPSHMPGKYALRDDLEWATTPWQELVPPEKLGPALTAFKSGAVSAFRDAFAKASFPDQPSEIKVTLLDCREQNRLLQERLRESALPLLSLDLIVTAEHHLQVARLFSLSNGQTYSHALVSRPGAPPVEDQLDALVLPDEVMAVDDDIVTGSTSRWLAKELRARGCAVREMLSLLALTFPSKDSNESGDGTGEQCDGLPREIIDVVDLRDLLLGSRDAGLVVELPDGQVARAPYLLPWVSLVSRAKIPPSSERMLTEELWQLNLDFFRATGLMLSDCHPASLPLLLLAGGREDESMESFCQDRLREMRELPF